MISIKPNVPIQFYYKSTTSAKGQGQTSTWTLISTNDFSVFYCEWKGSFGDRLTAAQAEGVNDSATIRTFYNPAIYEALRTKEVIIIKNADSTAIVNNAPVKDNPNVYTLWGGVDNIAEENQFLEFKVRRAKVK